jgi:hypothetical protein
MDYDKLFSTARMNTYRLIVNNNEQAARKLYQWNVEVSAALYESLMLLEVALRNTLDLTLKNINSTLADKNGTLHTSEWLLDPNQLISGIVSGQEVQNAKTRVQHMHRSPSHDDILAQMTFGTWRYLLPSKGNSKKILLWNIGLKNAFSLTNYSVQQFSKDVQWLNVARNRIAHGEPLLDKNYAKNTMKSIYRVSQAIDVDFARYVKSTQRVSQVMKNRSAK